MKYIDGNILGLKGVGDVAKALSYSESYVSHLFKEKTGKTLGEYIREQKIAQGIHLLRNRKLTIAEISDCLNYDTPQAFNKAFKKHTGHSPGDYRRIYLETTL